MSRYTVYRSYIKNALKCTLPVIHYQFLLARSLSVLFFWSTQQMILNFQSRLTASTNVMQDGRYYIMNIFLINKTKYNHHCIELRYELLEISKHKPYYKMTLYE